MKLYHAQSGKAYTARATKKPRRSGHFGRTWDVATIIIDGNGIDGWRDYTWGANIYFPYQDRWYALSTDAVDAGTRDFVTKVG